MWLAQGRQWQTVSLPVLYPRDSLMTCPICNPNWRPLATWRAICLTILAMGLIFGILWAVYEVTA